jgi:hypothetical protein
MGKLMIALALAGLLAGCGAAEAPLKADMAPAQLRSEMVPAGGLSGEARPAGLVAEMRSAGGLSGQAVARP